MTDGQFVNRAWLLGAWSPEQSAGFIIWLHYYRWVAMNMSPTSLCSVSSPIKWNSRSYFLDCQEDELIYKSGLKWSLGIW